MNRDDAQGALQDIDSSRRRLADTVAQGYPPVRHAAFAAIMAGLVACGSVPLPWNLLMEAFLLLSMFMIYRWDLRRNGMFINGWRQGSTRRLTWICLVVTLALYLLGAWEMQVYHRPWAGLLGAVPAFIMAYGTSALWMRVYLRELRAGTPVA